MASISIESSETCPSRPTTRQKLNPATFARASTATSANGPGAADFVQAQPSLSSRSQAPLVASSAGTDSSSRSPSSARHVAEARAAVLASIGNMMDRELQGRAAMLHDNAAAIARQERDLARATEALGRENDKLARLAADAARKLKEVGNVQNWAEVLERDFMVLGETLRLVREGSESGSERSWSATATASDEPSPPSGSREGNVLAESEREQSAPSGAMEHVAEAIQVASQAPAESSITGHHATNEQ